MSKISTVNLNDSTADLGANTETPAPVEQPASGEVPETETAVDIDTDELEALLIDIKKTKKLNKTPPKPRVRKPKVKVAVVEEAPAVADYAVAEPFLEEPADIDPVVVESKPKRQYNRKPNKIPEAVPEPTEAPVERPVGKTAGNLIEEMQRAERALRYQMRKNKMQTLVSHAF